MSPISFRRKTIRSDKTLGEQLEEARNSMRLTIADAERATRIRSKYLIALEQNRFDVLPEEIYAIGFVQRYAQFLGLDAQVMTKMFRGERLVAEKLGWTPAIEDTKPLLTATKSIGSQSVVITPKLFWVGASLAIILMITGYLTYQVKGFVAPPNLNLAEAEPDMIVSTPSFEIKGQTDGQASVTINSEPVTIDPDGRFIQEVKLSPGINTIQVSAKNRLNKETTKQIRVLAKIPVS